MPTHSGSPTRSDRSVFTRVAAFVESWLGPVQTINDLEPRDFAAFQHWCREHRQEPDDQLVPAFLFGRKTDEA